MTNVTIDSRIVHAPRCTLGDLNYALGKTENKHYTVDDRQRIAWLYWDVCTVVGVDPLIAVAQLVHETANLTSWWSQRPRRNPAGIGVELPPDHPDYLKVGVHFPGWSWAVRAHVGRLLLYAGHDAQDLLTNARLSALRIDANAVRPLPAEKFGTGKTVGTLAKAGWATDADYAHKLVTVANRIAAR
jgi:hypothetical protein